MKARLKEAGRRILDPVAAALAALGVTPNQVTFAGFFWSLAAAVAAAAGRFRLTMVFLLLNGACDVLDGSLARRLGRSSRLGAFLDSTIDRYAELSLFLGLAIHYAGRGAPATVGAAFAAAAGSFLVSYTRARAEGLGLECKVGLMERPERLVAMILATAAGPGLMPAALWGLAVLTQVTALQRILHVRAALIREMK